MSTLLLLCPSAVPGTEQVACKYLMNEWIFLVQSSEVGTWVPLLQMKKLELREFLAQVGQPDRCTAGHLSPVNNPASPETHSKVL